MLLALAAAALATPATAQRLPDTVEWSVPITAPPAGAPILAGTSVVVPLSSGHLSALALDKGARLTLVAAKRWKAQRTGVEPLRELVELGEKKGAGERWYFCAGDITENARQFARDKAVKVVEGPELARLAST